MVDLHRDREPSKKEDHFRTITGAPAAGEKGFGNFPVGKKSHQTSDPKHVGQQQSTHAIVQTNSTKHANPKDDTDRQEKGKYIEERGWKSRGNTAISRETFGNPRDPKRCRPSNERGAEYGSSREERGVRALSRDPQKNHGNPREIEGLRDERDVAAHRFDEWGIGLKGEESVGLYKPRPKPKAKSNWLLKPRALFSTQLVIKRITKKIPKAQGLGTDRILNRLGDLVYQQIRGQAM